MKAQTQQKSNVIRVNLKSEKKNKLLEDSDFALW